ncbi:hypothetical protein QTG54_013410 [Skeletonema marinoi]|uniref:Uncharacterized protein n=1 Tax=Skeletonema marinoi TaxID=267567 RepID=A0AAD9D7H1_9STRA|nr:hypothetical protein QTG54_013410 [Skeletonema marinoi]
MADAINTNDANNNDHQLLSRRAAKKAKRKQQKADKKRQVLDAYMSSSGGAVMMATSKGGSNAQQQSTVSAGQHHAISNDSAPSSVVGGKAARARFARQHDINLIAILQNNDDNKTKSNDVSWQQHRPQGGAPILSQVLPQHIQIVEYLEDKEQQMRMQGRGVRMKERMVVEVDCHGSMDSDVVDDGSSMDNKKCGHEYCKLSRMNLRGNFTLVSLSSLLATPTRGVQSSISNILHLDLSRNELWNISTDALEPLAPTLQTLDISRNLFESLPSSIGTTLTALRELRATHNLLKPNALHIDVLKGMNELVLIDLRFNQKCGKQSLLESLQSTLGARVEVKLTVTYPPPPPPTPVSTDDATTELHSDKVGESPAVRDATLLRSQLEPWSTMALRRRLVADFGEKRTNDGRSWADDDVSRGQVMNQLLRLYQEEASKEGKCHDGNGRAVVNVSGTLVEESIRKRVLHSLREFWTSKSSSTGNRERPSIAAENYMILCSPTMFDATSQNAAKAAIKLKKYEALWNLAHEAINSVDPFFASQYTAVAVTHNFEGSPHIDKQNLCPFYGFAVGDYEDGTGGIMVECSARVVAKVNTKNRMARVDGRYPHWVGPYDSKRDRYSLIYYRTDGEVEPIGPAVFTVPSDNV